MNALISRSRFLLSLAVATAGAIAPATFAAAGAIAAEVSATTDDPYLWLEKVDDQRAMDWVRAENAKTLGVLEADQRFASYGAQSLAIAEYRDRIPTPRFLHGEIYNFWQDAQHVRGLWRHTSPADYAGQTPHWRLALDLDRMAERERANWVWKGADCVQPEESRCLLYLSDGGEDAVTVREFDLAANRFVAGGFDLPSGKQSTAWEDSKTLLVAREWGKGELTTAGYPFIVKRWRRGTPLSSAKEIYRGNAQDGGYGVTPITFTDGEDHQLALIVRPLTTFEAQYFLVDAEAVRLLALPAKLDLQGLVSGCLILSVNEDWQPVAGPRVRAGSVVALEVSALRADPAHLQPTVVYEPGPREGLEQAAAGGKTLLVHINDNVRGRVRIYRRSSDGHWSGQPVDLPDNAATDIVDANPHSSQAFVSVSSFLAPSTLYQLDSESGAAHTVKSLAAQFDASTHVVEQFEALSPDGTKVPYFVVRPKQMRMDGSHATIIDAYGGFQVVNSPFYSGTMGKLWLEHGGTFVLANIRGGGEFGPAWHEAGLKTRRQAIYDDFSAVARDLIGRGITTPRRLGIMGGSNGGLLMGVQLNQHPDLWHAVDIQVPLLDMLRYEFIAAGPSWVGEYGSVSVPEERSFLAGISPYQNLRKGEHYPMPFVWTTTKDDRVGPQHARKFAARLAEYGIPYLYYEVIEGGHGSGANLKESAHTRALEMLYFTRQLMD